MLYQEKAYLAAREDDKLQPVGRMLVRCQDLLITARNLRGASSRHGDLGEFLVRGTTYLALASSQTTREAVKGHWSSPGVSNDSVNDYASSSRSGHSLFGSPDSQVTFDGSFALRSGPREAGVSEHTYHGCSGLGSDLVYILAWITKSKM
jgi:hypothetical protein